MQNQCAEIKIRAERRGGELLIEKKERGERDAGQGGDRKSPLQAESVKLSDLDIDYAQSHRWQKIASAPTGSHPGNTGRSLIARAWNPASFPATNTSSLPPGNTSLHNRVNGSGAFRWALPTSSLMRVVAKRGCTRCAYWTVSGAAVSQPASFGRAWIAGVVAAC